MSFSTIRAPTRNGRPPSIYRYVNAWPRLLVVVLLDGSHNSGERALLALLLPLRQPGNRARRVCEVTLLLALGTIAVSVAEALHVGVVSEPVDETNNTINRIK